MSTHLARKSLTFNSAPMVRLSDGSRAAAVASSPLDEPTDSALDEPFYRPRRNFFATFVNGVKRRWLRERRRRKVGRAYDMALEIARTIPRGSEVLDVGCGNGFIAHHLSALLKSSVLGIDLADSAEAAIDYRRFDGTRFPLANDSVDALLLCYVLHHAQDVPVVLTEARRVLRTNGIAVIYEDVPQNPWDRLMCSLHNQRWRARTGRCTFRQERQWRELFGRFGFEIIRERQLSRWRNLTHAVSRRLYLLKPNRTE